ncbi:MAG: orotidine 5'-phosphate decarboxylase [Treponema sp.]|jgi:3-hexulose-6-phosphate synthase|nr:orotidine 5'-phosphate decarboxylase [Treponema sp.]
MAIDRVSLEEAERIIREAGDSVDIIEVGTSLIKEFGITRSIEGLKSRFPGRRLLADIKVMDEGAYEFGKTYEADADIATVMGVAAMATIEACRDTARCFGMEYMIDLLETPDEKIRALAAFGDAIFCLHLPSDLAGEGLRELVIREKILLNRSSRTAAAGGVTLESIPFLKQAGVDIAVVGSAITKNENIGRAAAAFADAVHE